MSNEDIICEFEEQYPQLSMEFKNLQNEQYVLFSKKMLSYGINNITLGSSLQDSSDIKLSITGILIRVLDKVNRLKNLIVKGVENPIEDESEEDTWKDISNYGLIALLVRRGKWKK
jgi:hypothetical protein